MLLGSPSGWTAFDFRLSAKNIPLGRKGNPKQFVSVCTSLLRGSKESKHSHKRAMPNNRVVMVRTVRIIRPIM